MVKEDLENILKAGIIMPALSAWSFLVVIVTKKGGKPRLFVEIGH